MEKTYYWVDVSKVDSTYFENQKNWIFNIWSNPKWERKTNGNPVTVTALSSVEEYWSVEEFYKEMYPLLVKNIQWNLRDAIVIIDQPPNNL